ncbi:type VI secretion system baseplate subunit TssK [Chitinimonas arctica]|uniref:Type VI secretion system baseplate subunit TssK n=1 Tax=Chitinimonas arctica TaxID=2594795 RepID=A0A516SK25_9NEIS|nr:type VI secretion system baseplate subunit TssK [Chitinimonas arctica]QDQ28509.1 type VI secretion system baseplate subunit TssK [Chitinimonas arctica]
MDISAPLPEAIQWSEGMLLSPQHLQQNDIYWQNQLRHQLMAVQPYYWGLVAFDYDESALAAGRVRIERLHAVMPDGLVVQYPGSDGQQTLVLDLKQTDWSGEAPLRVYLAVPVRDKGAASVGSPIQRFEAVPGMLEVDDNTLENRLAVGRLRPLLSLQAGSRIPPRYVLCPLLEIVRDAGGHDRLGPYQPPLLRMCAGAFLGEDWLDRRMCRLVDALRAKIRDLVGGRRVDDPLAGLDQESRQQLFVARHLAAMLPLFELRLRSGVAHPHDIYLALAAMVGQLAALGTNPSPPVLDAYRHEDSRAGFLAALDFIEARLGLISPPFEAMSFERVSPGCFRRSLPADMRTDRLIIELRPRQDQAQSALRQWMAQARVGSETLMPVLAQRRLPGARLVLLDPRRAGGLNVSDGALLYELINQPLDHQDRRVDVMQAGQPLMIQGPADGGGPREIVLHRDRATPAGPPLLTPEQEIDANA